MSALTPEWLHRYDSADLTLWPMPSEELMRCIPDLLSQKDRSLGRLPHPVRFKRMAQPMINRYIFAPCWDELVAGLNLPRLDESENITLSIPHVRNVFGEMNEKANAANKGFNGGTGRLPLVTLHYLAHQGAHIQATESLNRIMMLSDLQDIQADQLKLPYPNIFLELGEPEHRGSETLEAMKHPEGHPIEGMYISEAHYQPKELIGLKERDDLTRLIKDHPGERIRALSFMITYSPIHHRVLDDNLYLHTIYIPESRGHESLVSIIEESFESYRELTRAYSNLARLPDAFINAMLSTTAHAAKILLYMSMRSARIIENRERTRLIETAKRRKGAKQRKAMERALKTQDRIIVGPDQWNEDALPARSGRGTVRPHWRRGHWHTVRFGPGRTQSRLDFFEPVLVKSEALDDDHRIPAPKEYKVK